MKAENRPADVALLWAARIAERLSGAPAHARRLRVGEASAPLADADVPLVVWASPGSVPAMLAVRGSAGQADTDILLADALLAARILELACSGGAGEWIVRAADGPAVRAFLRSDAPCVEASVSAGSVSVRLRAPRAWDAFPPWPDAGQRGVLRVSMNLSGALPALVVLPPSTAAVFETETAAWSASLAADAQAFLARLQTGDATGAPASLPGNAGQQRIADFAAAVEERRGAELRMRLGATGTIAGDPPLTATWVSDGSRVGLRVELPAGIGEADEDVTAPVGARR